MMLNFDKADPPPSPINHGWTLDNGLCIPVRYTEPALPRYLSEVRQHHLRIGVDTGLGEKLKEVHLQKTSCMGSWKVQEVEEDQEKMAQQHRRVDRYGYRGSKQSSDGQKWMAKVKLPTTRDLHQRTFPEYFLSIISSSSNPSKIITILYAVFGIPLMLLYLTRMGDLLARIFKSIYCSIFRRKKKVAAIQNNSSRYDEAQMHCPLADTNTRGKIYTTDDLLAERCRTTECLQQRQHIASIHRPVQCVRLQTMSPLAEEPTCPSQQQTTFKRNGEIVLTDSGVQQIEKLQNTTSMTVPLIISLFIVLGYLFSGAAMFYFLEDWSYIDSVFFCFTSLTTIGFGNLYPGENSNQVATDIKIVLSYIYLTLGMAIIAMCFNLMQEVVLKKTKAESQVCEVQPREQPDIYC
ncbi:Potassium channel subfamily K member 18 [Nymphon striatum]|nr:Potassium channel subfamily K member 18 [Nymphon striatum]